ncbi:MAG: prevent-host-death protein [Alphaproteobacteria bacterium]|nr:prevent-host-death protein [Alphaproteobacteria bacterium]
MRSMTVKEARDSFDRMLEAARREGVVLRDGRIDAAVVVFPEEYARLRQGRAERLPKAMDKIAAEATTSGLTEEELVELLKQPD